MGSDDGAAAGSLSELLAREPYRFDFYQAVRLAELLRPAATPSGHGGSNDEAVAFSSRVGLDFPASDLVAVDVPEKESEPVAMTVAFMGLAGASGPLPPPFTELVIQRTAARDYATRDFLDIFNHRLVAFLYRSRKKHRMGLNSRAPEETPWARWLFDLAGLDFLAKRPESRSRARPMLRYAGILAGPVRSMAGLEAMLSDHFGTPVAGEQMLGRWLPIHPRDQTRIGARRGANRRLGVDTVVGTRAWDQAGRIRLRVQGLQREKLGTFLPAQPAFRALQQMTRTYLQQDVDVELRLSLAPGQTVGARLDRAGGFRLGWTSWLGTARSRGGDDPVRLALPGPGEARPDPAGGA